ncbi:DapH/DapD/GlmU-related protein [Rahnella woolbedingensis]|uniref:Acetyltransferase n=1 Tax=Rahnella woolbedingensis TaxID=1510574 RepID=A0A419NE39_9GAMM|nr:DapH/DapD/GlmU-related protein [Rahnella woolbedingensis]RJT47021.1 acetyltransferase [Rahnella woolbedingensis]
MIFRFIKRYGFFGTVRLARDVLITKLFFPDSCRIVRYPFYIRCDNKISYGTKFTSGVGLRIDLFGSGTLVFGKNVQVNDYVHLAVIDSVIIGDNTLIASKVFITDHNHGMIGQSDKSSSPLVIPSQRPLVSAPVVIGERVWIGENVTILPGITIGNGSIIAAGAIVTHDIPDNSIAAGVPAKIVKTYNFETFRWES